MKSNLFSRYDVSSMDWDNRTMNQTDENHTNKQNDCMICDKKISKLYLAKRSYDCGFDVVLVEMGYVCYECVSRMSLKNDVVLFDDNGNVYEKSMDYEWKSDGVKHG